MSFYFNLNNFNNIVHQMTFLVLMYILLQLIVELDDMQLMSL
jgi:hypothetical protein